MLSSLPMQFVLLFATTFCKNAVRTIHSLLYPVLAKRRVILRVPFVRDSIGLRPYTGANSAAAKWAAKRLPTPRADPALSARLGKRVTHALPGALTTQHVCNMRPL